MVDGAFVGVWLIELALTFTLNPFQSKLCHKMSQGIFEQNLAPGRHLPAPTLLQGSSRRESRLQVLVCTRQLSTVISNPSFLPLWNPRGYLVCV